VKFITGQLHSTPLLGGGFTSKIGGGFTESVLIVSNSEKSVAFFKDMLGSFSCGRITAVKNCQEARRMYLKRDFDLAVINSPLSDESGETLSKDIASKGITQVILIVKSDFYDDISRAVEDCGVITIARPVNKNIFQISLKLVKAVRNRLKAMQYENSRLTRKIEDIRIINRAKCLLISHLSMSENEAHKYIEKQAMDMRITKTAVAEGILKTYEE